MYNDDKYRGINLKDIIIKVVFAIIFILLIIWLFPKVPNMKPFYSNVFRENIKYMQDAAESYYTNDKLPKNVGDSVEMTLGEMIDKNIVLPFVDKDGKSCDTKASYVQVTKNSKDYTLLVNLVCPTEKNTLKKTLGCHDYCENCDKTAGVIEYQFKKPVTTNQTVYSCPNGGTLSGTKCNVYTTSSYKATATTTADKYSCPNGGTLSGTKCIVKTESTYDALKTEGKTTYSCPTGSKLSGTTCVTEVTYCPDGYTYNGKNCSKLIGYTCPSGYSLNSSNECVKEITYCPTGYTYNGKNCSKLTGYTCPSGYSLNKSNECVKEIKNVETKTLKELSIDAEISGYETKYTTKTYTKATDVPAGSNCGESKSIYSCSGTSCGSVPTKEMTCQVPYQAPMYSCPAGYTRSGKTCTPTSCPTGYTKDGDKCTKTTTTVDKKTSTPKYDYKDLSKTTITDKATKKYDYKDLSTQKTTEKATKIAGNITYYCNTGDTLSGTKCITVKETSSNATKTEGKTTYSCPNGGDLKDKNCVSSKLTNTYNATASTKTTTKYEYKWSKEEALAGWTKTGKTRTVK